MCVFVQLCGNKVKVTVFIKQQHRTKGCVVFFIFFYKLSHKGISCCSPHSFTATQLAGYISLHFNTTSLEATFETGLTLQIILEPQ